MVNEDYVRGFFDGEGCVVLSPVKDYFQVFLTITNSDLSILLEIKEFLTSKGYHPTLREDKRKARAHRLRVYYLALKRWGEVIRFGEEIGTLHSEKRMKFERIKAENERRPRRLPRTSKEKTIKSVEQMLKHSERMI